MVSNCYVFGPFRLEVKRRLLCQGTTSRQLSERLFVLLLTLVEADGELVTRDELAQRVWGAEGVTDTNLNQHVYLLREMLGERRGERRYILTDAGRGYRFVEPVRPFMRAEVAFAGLQTPEPPEPRSTSMPFPFH